MARPGRRALAREVTRRYPRTFAQDLGARSVGSPSGAFRVLVMALLMSARIRASVALDAARALVDHGWTTPQRMAGATWSERARVLNRAGYARYDERTSRMLGDTAEQLLDRYRGDLRRLREEAERDPATERRLLKRFPGIGDVGVDIAFRELQRDWDELAPFADRRALAAAARLGLGSDLAALRRVAGGDDLVLLVNGLVRVDLDDAYDDVRAAAEA